MTSGVIGMRSHISSLRGINTFAINGTTGDRKVLGIEDMKKYAVQLLEQLDALMTEDICDHKSSHKLIATVCSHLKSWGRRLDDDSTFRQQLDLYFDLLRNTLRKPKLSPFARTMILEVIELRANKWAPNEDIEEYYRRKISEFETNESYCVSNDFGSELQKSQSFASTPIACDLSKSSTKLTKPAKGKTFLRDEVLIRNGDSGKVTVGAKERVVQITGPSEDSIERAKELIETTIKRNASPVPFECPNRSFESNFSQNTTEENTTKVFESTPIRSEPTVVSANEPKMSHSFTVDVNDEVIHLSTNNYELGVRAQHLLKKYLRSGTPLEPNQKAIGSEKNHSPIDSTSDKEVVSTSNPKREIMAALDTASKGLAAQPKINRIQRSSSQGTVPIGRTSLRFMSKSVGHESAPIITYERQFLMDCSVLPSSKNVPNIEVIEKLYKRIPEIIRKHNNSGENVNALALNKSHSFTQSRVITVDNWE